MYMCLYSVDLHQNHECNDWIYLEEIDRDRSEAYACNKKNVLENERVLSAKVATFLLRLSENIFSSHINFLLPHIYFCRCQEWKIFYDFTVKSANFAKPGSFNSQAENLLLVPALNPITFFW